MNTRELKHVENVVKWENMIRLCRTSGMSVTRWCAANQINIKTYYKWERVCLKEASQRMNFFSKTPGMIRFYPNRLPDETNDNALSVSGERKMMIHCGHVSIEIHSEMPVARIADLVNALNSHV